MDLRNTAVFADADILIVLKKAVLSQWIEQSVFLPVTGFYKAVEGSIYRSWYMKMLVASAKNSVWGRGRICHGISMPGDGRMRADKNTCFCKMAWPESMLFYRSIIKPS